MRNASSSSTFAGRTKRRLPVLIAAGIAAGLLASGPAEAHRVDPAAAAPRTPPRALLRMAQRAPHHGRALARTSSTFSFSLGNPQAQCYIGGMGTAFKSLSISGPRVYGADANTIVYWRGVAWRAGSSVIEAATGWHSQYATTTWPAVFANDHIDIYDFNLSMQVWYAGVQIYRSSATRGLEYASAAYLPFYHDVPFFSGYTPGC